MTDYEGLCEECGCELDENDSCPECEEEARMWRHEEENDPDSPYYLIDGVGFADPGGNSALRAATRSNPRNLPCPTCGRENMLTPLDRARGYCCDECADRNEGMGW